MVTNTYVQDRARDVFFVKHANERKERWVSGNFVYFVMERITDIYFVVSRHALPRAASSCGVVAAQRRCLPWPPLQQLQQLRAAAGNVPSVVFPPRVRAQGGFGTVQWIEPSHYLSQRPDNIVLNSPTRTLQVRRARARNVARLCRLPVCLCFVPVPVKEGPRSSLITRTHHHHIIISRPAVPHGADPQRHVRARVQDHAQRVLPRGRH